MTQKDKVKELVGRGLHSYHTKALQQMDRIQKKNKEQNHKISILTNELDNDYLTKTEEGSVVSLEHSKEGMVYLDELQGNTLVNYCTDGSKELTLNGDIDVEGTFVTTTEGVDNGLVDVMCEGNTLVNVLNKSLKFGLSSTSHLTCDENGVYNGILEGGNYFAKNTDNNYWRELQPNTTYTLKGFLETTCNTTGGRIVFFTQDTDMVTKPLKEFRANELNQRIELNLTFTTPSSCVGSFGFYVNPVANFDNVKFSFILEYGDTTSYEIPSYFEGMKSVGQDDENGHKIEILSKNKNLFNPEEVYESSYSYGVPFVNSVKCQEKDGVFTRVTSANSWNSGIGFHVKTEKNKDYTLSVGEYFNDGVNMDIRCIGVYKSEYPFKNNNNIQSYANRIGAKNLDSNNNSLTYNSKDYDYILFYIGGKWDENANGVKTFRMSKIEVNQSSTKPTNYTKQNLNKKEILLNEPLRGLPNGINDRFVKIGGKCYIERNRGVREYQEGDLDLTDVITDMTNTEYSLETPIYEPLEIEPTLFCYSDTTHISNNSIIPCNMKIQNSGYNAIIKPSTLYTIALDTNQSGTIGMNLGGVKGTTTNNVLTLTTPATLTDDSLRLYGKGIKGSKVRLLEGDKTNWIPSHFEGMKSSFEDKFDATDNTYKMEILSNNENLFDNSKNRLAQRGSVVLTYDENSKTYTVNNTGGSDGRHQGDWGASTFYDASGKPESRENLLFLKCKKGDKISIKAKGTFSQMHIMERNNYNSTMKSLTYNQQEVVHTISHECTTRLEIVFVHPTLGTTFTVKDIQIGYLDKVFENYIENKHNKIQFSSIEPLRSLPNGIKDKFIFKDEKLMIERNCGEIIFDGSEIWLAYNSEYNINNIIRLYTTRPENSLKPNDNTHRNYMISDKLFTPSNGLDASSMSNNLHSFSTYISYGTGTLSICLPKSVLSSFDEVGFKEWLSSNTPKYTYELAEPTYEEIPYELQKIILEGYENGTLFFDTNIPPTSTVTYAGETPIVKSVKLNKTEVSNNTDDINDNIIPYLMDMDYRVVCLQLESNIEGISMSRLFGGTYEMLKRDIQSNRLSKEEYGYRLIDYFNAGKLTKEEVRELEDLK